MGSKASTESGGDSKPNVFGSVNDKDGLREYSVVYSDRALNHMSERFQGAMKSVSATLKEVYNAEATVLVPGSGTYGMEAVAREFGTKKKCIILRNGFFSFRWSQIFEQCNLGATKLMVQEATPTDEGRGDVNPQYRPADIDELVKVIAAEKPDAVFAPHVETSAGMILPDDYIQRLGEATRAAGGIFVLDCIASGTIWVDMKALSVDVVISAPQKGWSGPACVAMVALGARAAERMAEGKDQSGSFSCNLRSWKNVMDKYEAGGHSYFTTMPTDAILKTAHVMAETRDYGFAKVKEEQAALGAAIRAMFKRYRLTSVAADGFGAPGVVVVHVPRKNPAGGLSMGAEEGAAEGAEEGAMDGTTEGGMEGAEEKKVEDAPAATEGDIGDWEPVGGIAGLFKKQNVQIAGGVPLKLVNDPRTDSQSKQFMTFRIGLFGLEKLHNIPRTVQILEDALKGVAGLACAAQ